MTNRTKQTSKGPDAQRQQGLIIGGVIGLVAVIAIIIVFASSQGTSQSSGIDFTADQIGEEGANVQQFRTDDGGHVLGNPDAPVTIVAFEDFLCPVCQQYKPEVNRIIDELVLTGEAKFEYRFLPTQRDRSIYAAQLAECAGDLQAGGFWTAHDELFDMYSNTPALSNSDARGELADRMGLNDSELIECTRDAEQIYEDQQLATRNGIRATPTVRLRFGDDGPLQAVQDSDPQEAGVSLEDIRAAITLGGGSFIPPQ